MAGVDLEAERTRLTAAQADAKEMQNAVTRRELLPVSSFIRALTAGVVEVRSRFLAQPRALAPDLIGVPIPPVRTIGTVAALYGRHRRSA